MVVRITELGLIVLGRRGSSRTSIRGIGIGLVVGLG